MLVTIRGEVTTRFKFERQLERYEQFVHSYQNFPKTSLEVEALSRMLVGQGGSGNQSVLMISYMVLCTKRS